MTESYHGNNTTPDSTSVSESSEEKHITITEHITPDGNVNVVTVNNQVPITPSDAGKAASSTANLNDKPEDYFNSNEDYQQTLLQMDANQRIPN